MISRCELWVRYGGLYCDWGCFERFPDRFWLCSSSFLNTSKTRVSDREKAPWPPEAAYPCWLGLSISWNFQKIMKTHGFQWFSPICLLVRYGSIGCIIRPPKHEKYENISVQAWTKSETIRKPLRTSPVTIQATVTDPEPSNVKSWKKYTFLEKLR